MINVYLRVTNFKITIPIYYFNDIVYPGEIIYTFSMCIIISLLNFNIYILMKNFN